MNLIRFAEHSPEPSMKFSMQAWPWTSTSSLILLLLVAVVGNAAELRQPNVVFILADDLGWRDLSVEGKFGRAHV